MIGTTTTVVRTLWKWSIWGSVLLALAAVPGCVAKGPEKPPETVKTQRRVKIDGYWVPVFESAAKQLGYAESGFSSIAEQMAALNAVKRLFPSQRKEVAQSVVELGYLALGRDYRLATPDRCRKAVRILESVLGDYPEVKESCAKAQWYIGWIFTDLLHDRSKGIHAYHVVLAAYPRQCFYTSSRFAWPDGTMGGNPKRHPESVDKHWWGALALLEIFRNCEPNQKVAIARRLLARYPLSLSTAYCLLELVRSDPRAPTWRLARQYLRKNRSYGKYPFVCGQIAGELESHE